jgi:hypothetical protein
MKGSVNNGKNEVSLVTQPAMKSLLVGTRRYLYKVYNYHDSRAYGYKRSGILPRIEGMVGEWDSFLVLCNPLCPFVSFVTLCAPLWIILCNIL